MHVREAVMEIRQGRVETQLLMGSIRLGSPPVRSSLARVEHGGRTGMCVLHSELGQVCPLQTSGPSGLNLRVESLEFYACVGGRELPVKANLFFLSFAGPR